MTTTRPEAVAAAAVGISLVTGGLGFLLGSAFEPTAQAALLIAVYAVLIAVYAVLKQNSRVPAGLVTLGVALVVALATVGGYFYADTQQGCRQVKNVDGAFGAAVTIGGLQYVLTAVEQDLPSTVGTPPASRPIGEWFVVHGKVTNVADTPQTFPGTAARLIVCDARYEPDEALSTPARRLNPGLTIEIVQVFDVAFPPGDPVVVQLRQTPGARKHVNVYWDGWGSVA